VIALFWILAIAMTALALAFVLPPLLRPAAPATPADAVGSEDRARRKQALDAARKAGVLDESEYRRKLAALDGDGAARPGRALPIALAVALPALALIGYLTLGEPDGLDGELSARADGPRLSIPGSEVASDATGDPANAPTMDQAIAGLAQRMRETPDDLDGWMLLGRAYKSTENFSAAREALANALRLAPEEPEVMIEFAEATALASDTRRIGGESLLLLQRALTLDPENQRGLWLLGISSMQAGMPAEAVATWERLLPQLSGEAQTSLQRQIDMARADAGLPPSPQAQAPAAVAADSGSDASADAPARLTVEVDIAPALREQIGAGDVLFVYARAPEGPRMPLAIHRLPASSLPARVVLDDSTSMMPELKLSNMPQVVVGARISRSGLATPQAGDLEGQSSVVSNRHRETLRVLIDRRVEP